MGGRRSPRATDAPAARLPYAESRWERTGAPAAVDDAFLRARLAPWPELVGRPWSVLGGGLRHLNVRIGDDRVLRLARFGEQDLRREAALLRTFANVIRVPAVVGCADGALLLEHVAAEDLPATEEAGLRVGRTAARIHERRFPRSGPLDADLRVAHPFPSALEGLRSWAEEALSGEAGRRLGARAERIRGLWRREQDRLASCAERPVLLHSDFKPANVKWLPDERDVVVFDWEFSWAGPALFDVGQMFRWGVPAEFADGFVRGYRDGGGELPEGWRRTAELFDLFNLVGLLDHAEAQPVRDRDVLDRIERTFA